MVRGEREGEKEYQNQQQTNQMNNLVMFHSSRSGSSDTQQCHTIQYIKILCWSEKLVVLLFDSFFSDLVNLSFLFWFQNRFFVRCDSIFFPLKWHLFVQSTEQKKPNNFSIKKELNKNHFIFFRLIRYHGVSSGMSSKKCTKAKGKNIEIMRFISILWLQ